MRFAIHRLCAITLLLAPAWGVAEPARRLAQPAPMPLDLELDLLPGLDEPDTDVECVIMPDDIVEVSSGASGLIESIAVERSDPVRRGQVLAELESGVESATVALAQERAALEAQVNRHRAALSFDQRRHQRSRTLHERDVVSAQELDRTEREAAITRWKLREAEDRRRIAAMELDRAKAALDLRTVRSPIDGVVLERFKSPGEFVEEEPILRIARLDPLRVEVIVPIAQYGTIRVGMTAEVHPEVGADGARDAVVTLVDPVADPASGTFGVRLELPNPDNSLLGGIKCTAAFLDPPPHADTTPHRTVSGPTEDGTAPVEPATPGSGPEPIGPAARDGAPGAGTVAERDTEDPPDPDAIVLSEPMPEAGVTLWSEATASADALAASDSRPVPGAEPHICHRAGPLAEHGPEAALLVALEQAGLETVLRRTETQRARHVVLASIEEPTADQAGLTSRLRARGVEHMATIGRGRLAGRISLGAYTYESAARRRRAALADLGIASEIEPLGDRRDEYWIDIDSAASDQQALRRALRAAAADLELRQVPCAEVIAARE